MYDKEIYLVHEMECDKEDEYGNPVIDRILQQRFANLKSISQTEFYQAQTNDYKPELKFELADCLDYAGEEKVIYEGFIYKVLRTFVNGRKIEITCYGGVRDASA
jgi:SPP1 family predicted phage head-tail adaptor